MTRDRARLLRLRGAWEAKPAEASLRKVFEEALAASRGTVAARALSAPVPSFDDSLPIAREAEQIVALIRAHQVVVIAGETGSGKTTQLPKLCLAAGRGAAGMIGCTQPRRIAARSVARRVAQELGVPVGGAVGFQVRFNDQVGPLRQQLAQIAEQEIDVEAALVRLVDDQCVVCREPAIGLHLRKQD
ncbi:MAG TPA: hypothetical protein VGT79_08260, partial [Xanthomonadaceae bacterium]|nr:hypothetical protein [Xanthomonadaceae bacterium]